VPHSSYTCTRYSFLLGLWCTNQFHSSHPLPLLRHPTLPLIAHTVTQYSILSPPDLPLLQYIPYSIANGYRVKAKSSALARRRRLVGVLRGGREALRWQVNRSKFDLAYTRYSFACFCVCKDQSSLYYPRPFALPILLQYFGATFAQYMTSPRLPFIWHTPYSIGNDNIV